VCHSGSVPGGRGLLAGLQALPMQEEGHAVLKARPSMCVQELARVGGGRASTATTAQDCGWVWRRRGGGRRGRCPKNLQPCPADTSTLHTPSGPPPDTTHPKIQSSTTHPHTPYSCMHTVLGTWLHARSLGTIWSVDVAWSKQPSVGKEPCVTLPHVTDTLQEVRQEWWVWFSLFVSQLLYRPAVLCLLLLVLDCAAVCLCCTMCVLCCAVCCAQWEPGVQCNGQHDQHIQPMSHARLHPVPHEPGTTWPAG